MLAFFSTNVDPGKLCIEPYLFQTTQSGFYNQNGSFKNQKTIHDLSTSLLLETGITSWLDITLFLTTSYNQIGHLHTPLYGDTQAYLGVQLLRDEKNSWIPDVRLLFGEFFPTGKYQHLNPKKQQSDSSGSGSYETAFVFVTRKIFYNFPKHPFNFNLNLEYILSTKTNVDGYNIYGGSFDTKGRVSPGGQYIFNLAMEFSFTRHFVIGMDIDYVHQNKSVFSGNPGLGVNEVIPPVGLPSSDLLSLAPTVEYTFNDNFGILGGCWFTVAGRNSTQFVSNVLSVYYMF